MALFSGLNKIINKEAKQEKKELTANERHIGHLLENYEVAERQGESDAVLKKAEYYKEYAEYYFDEEAGKRAIKLYEEATEMGFSIAFRELGHIYNIGEFVETDKEKSLGYYVKALELGDADTAYFLGKYYEEGKGTKKDLKKAAEVYRRGMELGASDAKAELGIAYFEGKGVSRDYAKAFRLLSESFDEEEKIGGYYLAICLFNGLGTEMDERHGFQVLQYTTDHVYCYKSDEAIELLIICYEKGIGTERNVKRADEVRKKEKEQDKLRSDLVKSITELF